MQTPEQVALSFTGECEPASLGLCANHKAPLGGATTCLHVLHLSELIRARDAEVAVKALRIVESVCMTTDGDHLDGDIEIPVGEVMRMILEVEEAFGIEREAGA